MVTAIKQFNDNSHLRAYICLAITAFCWGCNAIFARMAVGEVSPMLIVTLRWLGVVILMILITRRQLQRSWDVLRPHFSRLFLMGAFGMTAFNALFYISAYTTTALNIGIIQGAIPIYVLLGGLILYGTHISILQIVGVAMTIAGVCLVAASGEMHRLQDVSINQGDYLMVLACLMYAGYALSLKKLEGIPKLPLFAVICVAALIASMPLTLVEHLSGNLQMPTAKGWLIVALITLLPSFIAQVLFIQGVSDIGPGRAGIFVNLVPVFASLLA
ncbi:MAG: DMT family transporter, partial [Gammaproteobacteria bacterium]|nr:DMT family transporter [Gammaproteobacteria bacterium]